MAGSPPKDWNDHEKSALVEELLLRQLTLQQACERHDLSPDELRQWVRIFRRTVSDAIDDQLRSTLGVQGLEMDELSGRGLSGKIGEISVADLLQTLEMGKKTARLTVSHRNHEHHVWCSEGEIVDARSLSLTGKEALFRILSVSEGYVSVTFLSEAPARALNTSNQGLLLAAADRANHHANLVTRLGGPERRYRVANASPDISNLDANDAPIVKNALQPITLQALQEQSLSGDVPTLRAIERLLAEGYLQCVPTFSAPARSTAASGNNPTPSLFRVTSAPLENAKRPPLWLMGGGAALCMGMGAASAVTLIHSLDGENEPTSTRVVVEASHQCPAGMVLMTAGTFEMGTHSDSPTLSLSRPAHWVSLDRYCIGIHETTVAEYSHCVAAGACSPGHLYSGVQQDEPPEQLSVSELAHAEQCNSSQDDRQFHPINCVSHDQASTYCSWQSARLPSEAEWEFAAKGVEGRTYPWGSTPPSSEHLNACGIECQRWHERLGLEEELQGQAYREDDGFSGTAPVGYYRMGATPQGVVDMLGNVFEWTAGGLYPYPAQDQQNPVGPRTVDARIIRGGNFKSGLTEFTDPAVRFAVDSSSHLHGVGFRCAADVTTSGLAMNP